MKLNSTFVLFLILLLALMLIATLGGSIDTRENFWEELALDMQQGIVTPISTTVVQSEPTPTGGTVNVPLKKKEKKIITTEGSYETPDGSQIMQTVQTVTHNNMYPEAANIASSIVEPFAGASYSDLL